MGILGNALGNIGANIIDGIKNIAKGDVAGVFGNIFAGLFGKPPPGQSDKEQQQFGTAASTLASDPLTTLFKNSDDRDIAG